jgi:CspA family cold shock protein
MALATFTRATPQGAFRTVHLITITTHAFRMSTRPYQRRFLREPVVRRRTSLSGDSAMSTGTIRALRDQGFGFIGQDDNEADGDLFFHHTSLQDATFNNLQLGQRVRFDAETDPRDSRRRRAVNVQLLPLVDDAGAS